MKRTIFFALFLLCAFTSYPPSATAVLLDTDGEAVRNAGVYFMAPVLRPGGGITVTQSENEICPITVMKEQVLGRGLPVQFISRLKIATLSEGDLLTVRFPLVPWCAPTPSQWTVLRGSNEVKLSGYNNTVSGRFKVVKGTFQNSYTLSFCPLVGICRRVGGPYFGGSGNLVVGAKANVMQFRFQKLTGHLGDEVPVLAMKNYVSEE